MRRSKYNQSSVRFALGEKLNVMNAVMLRDMRTRFFDHGLGFLVVALWPLAHMGVLLTIYTVLGRSAPYGDSILVFFATGLIPTLAFMYISRFMSVSLLMNRPMMSFPIVTAIDIIVARAYLEITAAVLTLLFIVIILTVLDQFPAPNDPVDALFAYLTSIFLGIGVGTVVSVFVSFFNFAMMIYALIGILLYVTSGVAFSAPSMPSQATDILVWSPVFQCVEWMRVAYYPTYSNKLLDREYVLLFAACSLFLGLMLERLLRRKLLEG